MDTLRAATAQPALSLGELQWQLQSLVHLCDALAAHLESERDLATQRGEDRNIDELQKALLQVTRARNDVRSACLDLDEIGAWPGDSHRPAAA